MSPIESPIASNDRPKSSTARTRRVLSDRQTRRREKVLSQLVNPIAVAEDVDLLTHQAKEIYLAFKPRNGWQDWLTSEIAVIMIRINRCTRIERRMRDWAAYRAFDFWEDDQKVEVETLACKIAADPARVVAKLREMPAGLDWMLARWRILAKVEPQAWTDEQRRLAEFLVGGERGVDFTRPDFVADQIAELIEIRDRVDEADAIARGLVEADLSDDIPNLSRLRRYARSLHRQMKWYVDQFHVEHPDRWDDPRRQPAYLGAEAEARESTRQPRWNFADPAPIGEKTNSTAGAGPQVAANTPKDETKPTADAHHENDKTNPLFPTEAGKENRDVRSEVRNLQHVSDRQSAILESRSDRSHRGDPERDAAHRLKAARRRAALAGC